MLLSRFFFKFGNSTLKKRSRKLLNRVGMYFKLIKMKIKFLTTVFFSIILLSITSCSEDNESIESVNREESSTNDLGKIINNSNSIDGFLNTKYGNSYTITETFSVEIEEESFDLVKVTIDGESLIDVYLAYYPDTTIIRNFTEVNWESGIMEYIDLHNEETGSEYVNKKASILF